MKFLVSSSGALVNDLLAGGKDRGRKMTETFKVLMPLGSQKSISFGWVMVMNGHLYFIYFTDLGQVPTFYPQGLEQLSQYSLSLIHMLPKFHKTKFVNYVKDCFIPLS